MAFSKNDRFSYTCNRESVLKRPDSVFSLGSFNNDFSKKAGTPDCCALFSLKIKLSAREKKTVSFYFTVAKATGESKEIIINGRRNNLFSSFESAPSVINNSSKSGILAKSVLPKLIFTPTLCSEQKNAIYKNERAVDALWSLGISGDRPIILFPVKSSEDIPFLARVIKIHRAFLNVFIKNDLVILFNCRVKDEIDKAVKSGLISLSGVFAVSTDKTDEGTVNALIAFSSYYFRQYGKEESADNDFKRIEILQGKKTEKENALITDGYEINRSPVLPWCFIYSNDCFGTLVSDKCLGFTYAFNSYFNKLTDWTNDTRTDLNSEVLLIKSGEKFYNPTVNSNVIFTRDEALYKSICNGIEFTVSLSVKKDKMQKNIRIKMLNLTDKRKVFSLVYSVEPVMYYAKGKQRLLHFKKGKNSVSVFNPLNRDFRGEMRLSINEDADRYIFDKTALYGGKWGNYYPAACSYPVAALGKTMSLEKNEESEIIYSLEYISENKTDFPVSKNSVKIVSPDKKLDALINTFLPVQILRGRLQARTGFYQCSGAYGFRDQLQDALSLVITDPERLKKQILLCCSAQFAEGDVLHWFHSMPDGIFRGVRTLYADDRLWLAFAVGEYVNVTGDKTLLNEKIPFLNCPVLRENESERYVEISPSEESGSVLDHCIRAVEKSLVFGSHGLPLILGGDWNDGFNHVGRNGSGESVWLGQFLITVLERFIPLCDEERARRYKKEADRLKNSIDENAFNGEHYIRAFLDDGRALGDGNDECKIDSLTQSFAVFCGMPDKKRVMSALENAEKQLVDRENGLIKLFSDGFINDRRAGYISAYPVGLRENGGQYTHAAVWLADAFIKNGQTDKGYDLLTILNPLNKYADKETAKKYMTEPFFLAGDVYSRKGSEGRGGWTIYTGSAGWYYKTVIEDVFGIKKRGDKVFIEPKFPSEWKDCTLTLFFEGAVYEIEYIRSDRNAVFVDDEEKPYLTLDGKSRKIIVNFCGKN